MESVNNAKLLLDYHISHLKVILSLWILEKLKEYALHHHVFEVADMVLSGLIRQLGRVIDGWNEVDGFYWHSFHVSNCINF